MPTLLSGSSNGDSRYVPYLGLVPHSGAVCPPKAHGSYGTHLLDHLAADGAGLTSSDVAVIAVLQVYADLVGSFCSSAA